MAGRAAVGLRAQRTRRPKPPTRATTSTRTIRVTQLGEHAIVWTQQGRTYAVVARGRRRRRSAARRRVLRPPLDRVNHERRQTGRRVEPTRQRRAVEPMPVPESASRRQARPGRRPGAWPPPRSRRRPQALDCRRGGRARRRAVRGAVPSRARDPPGTAGDANRVRQRPDVCSNEGRGEPRFHAEGRQRRRRPALGLQGQGGPAELLGDVVRAVQGGDSGVRRSLRASIAIEGS